MVDINQSCLVSVESGREKSIKFRIVYDAPWKGNIVGRFYSCIGCCVRYWGGGGEKDIL